jgi:hypothetical protein
MQVEEYVSFNKIPKKLSPLFSYQKKGKDTTTSQTKEKGSYMIKAFNNE